MISRGEVGFILTEIGVTTGVLSGDVYTADHCYGSSYHNNYANMD